MRFQLIDAILEQSPERIVALKQVTAAEEYLGDHFPGFPVLPGVFMVEAMAQAARRLLGEADPPWVLGGVKALRYGSFVQPGETLVVEVLLDKRLPDGSVQFRGTGRVQRPGSTGEDDTAVAGRFTMRPVRLAHPAGKASRQA